jgi:hypothetical protein
MNLYTHIQQTVQEQYSNAIKYSKMRYVKEALIVVAALLVLGCSYFVYAWYQQRQNRHAFAALVEISKSYETALQKHREQKDTSLSEETENPWEDTQLLLEALASAHKNSSLAPFFVMYQAEVELHAHADYDKACQLMEQGVRRLAKNSIYYDMFNLKRIKMLLDSPMQDVRDRALAELERCGEQKNNYYAPEALYTLGAYHAYYGNMDKAIDAWKKLAQQEKLEEKALIDSPWIHQAQETLKTLNIAF